MTTVFLYLIALIAIYLLISLFFQSGKEEKDNIILPPYSNEALAQKNEIYIGEPRKPIPIPEPPKPPLNTDNVLDIFDTNLAILPTENMKPDFSAIDYLGNIYEHYTVKLPKPEFNIFPILKISKYSSHCDYLFERPKIKGINPTSVEKLIDDLGNYFPYSDQSECHLSEDEKESLYEDLKIEYADLVLKIHEDKLYSTKVYLSFSKDYGSDLSIYKDKTRSEHLPVSKDSFKNHRSIPVSDPTIFETDWNYVLCNVAGIQYNQAPKVIKLFSSGILLELELDLDNEHSKTAVKVLLNKFKIGYIPSELSPYISESLKNGDKLTASILSYDPLEEPYYQLKIRILKNHE